MIISAKPQETILGIRGHINVLLKRLHLIVIPRCKSCLKKWIRTYLDVFSKEERKFLCTHLRLNEEPWGFLYLLFKVHKNPLETRPVVSFCVNLLHPLGKLITEWLQLLAKMQKSYFQDSFMLKMELDIQKVPSNARLFICDATSMYTNIKTGPALHHI